MLVQRLDVQAMVERKVMAFSVDRVEEILRSVIDNELRMIIITGYVLGGIIGLGTFSSRERSDFSRRYSWSLTAFRSMTLVLAPAGTST